jgi:hypothetical protein
MDTEALDIDPGQLVRRQQRTYSSASTLARRPPCSVGV